MSTGQQRTRVAVLGGGVAGMIFVANPISLACGREIFGFNKAWGRAELPDADALDRFHLDVPSRSITSCATVR